MTDGYSGNRDKAYDRLVRQEELILDVTERLTEALRETGSPRRNSHGVSVEHLASCPSARGRKESDPPDHFGHRGGRWISGRRSSCLPTGRLWREGANGLMRVGEDGRRLRGRSRNAGSAARVQAPPVREPLAA